MAITRAKKEEIVADLTEKFGKAKSVVFARYKGVNVKDFTNLRGKLRAEESEAKVAKNTLVKIALKDKKVKLPEEFLQGQMAIFFSYSDELSAPKNVYDFAKANESMKIKGGIFEGAFIEKSEVEKLACIPSHEELLAKLVATLDSPVRGFVTVLSGNLRALVYALNAIKDTKPAQ
jgi:large subunit ribosomal protein L10